MRTIKSILTNSLRRRGMRIALTIALLAGIGWLILFLTIPRPLFSSSYSTLLYSKDNELLGARIATDGQWRFPPTDSLPEKFKTCLLQFEDKRFYGHPGIDPFALARAFRLNLSSGAIQSGGSTITMQLARIARGNQRRTLGQKLLEMSWALFLETVYSKTEILNLYASHAPFGGNVVGAETASWRYFGRQLENLSWAESATLAVLPNSPALIHPGRNRDQLKRKRDRLLFRLREKGFLSPTEYELACLEPLPDAPLALPNQAPHLLDRLAQRQPGTRLRTTLDGHLQRIAHEIVDRYAHTYSANHIYNLAVLIAEVETGQVLAYVGNASLTEHPNRGENVDLITAPRSTGSVLKPFLYAAMLHDGLLLPGTLVNDTPLNINGFTPRNFNHDFYGAVPAHVAIERSLNVPLVRMLSTYNTGRFMALLKAYGMTTLRFPESHYGASLILGGAEGTLWDLAGMYASAARVLGHYRTYDGRYDPSDIHPLTPFPQTTEHPIESIADERLDDRSPLSHASLWFMAEALSALNRPEEEADWQQFESMKRVAWKTGTSYGSRDAWAIGFTPRYVIGVWCGNASGEGRAGLTGVGHAAPVLFDLFSLLPDSPWFDEPYDELTPLPVCRDSGHKASAYCEEVDTLWVPTSGLRTAPCPYHHLAHLSMDGRYQVNSSCEPTSRIVTKKWFTLPPAQEYYYRRHHVDYRPLPPFKPGCTPERPQAIALIYPEHGATIYLPKGFGGEREKLILRAAHANPMATIYWHLDDLFVGQTTDQHEIALDIAPGQHLLTLIDNEGNQRRILFNVRP